MYDFFFVRAINNNQTKVKIIEFLANQSNWMRTQIKKRSDPVWRHVSYVVSQYDGVIEGYRSAANDLKVKLKIILISLILLLKSFIAKKCD